METGRTRPTHEEEAQRVTKQQKASQVLSRGVERTDIQPLGTSMGALGAMLPWPWSNLYCFPKTWLSCEV